MTKEKDSQLSRRDLLKAGALAGASLGVTSLGLGNELGAVASTGAEHQAGTQTKNETVAGMKYPRTETVRMGIIGVGGRGTGLLRDLLAIDHLEVKAVCDVVKEKALKAQAMAEKAGQKSPTFYTKNDRDFENLCARDDLDLIYIATPWDWHVPMAVAALNQGKHVGVEVPAAKTLKECWELVDASEKNRRHCVMLENCCYGYNEMMVLNMIRAGLFGEILHGEAAYNHDLRELLFSNAGEGLWRRFEHVNRNGNLYPTHGLGPVANYMNINRGDRFDYLVSVSSPQLSMDAYRKEHVPAGDPKWKEKYNCGDMNTSIIKTAKGRTIMLQHTVSTPHPYDRINLVSGTKGIFRDYPPRLFLDGQEGKEDWTTLDKHKAQFEHPLWKRVGELARKTGGHGGMDFIMSYRLIQCMREGLVPDMDVYDAAAWSAPGPLSEMSVAGGSAPVKFPDFTRGRWQDSRNIMAAS
ncbi:MAG: Gfo/Idh/MocA family oxidoreductase [Pyrinomonadaceae bacterium]|nr:Gfo/Idh/MocA family oxidoreductase [Pyrinomonadaceae bacterium]